MPSSLTEVLPSTSVCSTSPPVSVCGTDATSLARGFSRQCGLNPCGSALRPPLSITPQVCARTDLPIPAPSRFGGSLPTPGPTPLRPPFAHIGASRDGTLDPLSIAYGFRPRLRPASPAADQHRRGTLGHPVGGIRTPLALLMPTFALPAAPGVAPARPSPLTGTLPYHAPHDASAASVLDLSPGGLSAPRHVRPVSYYALFQGWLLLSQPPGCLRAATTLPT